MSHTYLNCDVSRYEVNTTRKRLIAALVTTGEYDLKMPAVKPSRVA
jgi:hypothetical protein